MSFIRKYILPKQIDFDGALKKQAEVSCRSVTQLYQACIEKEESAFTAIESDEKQSRTLKKQNMKELLDVFLTPYDKESIYRIIIQLDWIARSVKHLTIDLSAYKVQCPPDYEPIFTALMRMAGNLEQGFSFLPTKDAGKLMEIIEGIHDSYDHVAKLCALKAVEHLERDSVKTYLAYRQILTQIKDVAKRIHLAADTLEDMTIKIV